MSEIRQEVIYECLNLVWDLIDEVDNDLKRYNLTDEKKDVSDPGWSLGRGYALEKVARGLVKLRDKDV